MFLSTNLGVKFQNVGLSVATRFAHRRVMIPLPRYRQDKIIALKELVEQGAFGALIDHTYPLENVVEATRYVESEQKIGNVVLTV